MYGVIRNTAKVYHYAVKCTAGVMKGENTVAQQQKNGQEQDLNQLRKVRREKLAELQQNGKDPFVITKYDQTHHS